MSTLLIRFSISAGGPNSKPTIYKNSQGQSAWNQALDSSWL